MLIHGGCHCGKVRYEAEIDPARVTICHCTDCQQLSGSAWRVNVPAPFETFRLTRGETAGYVKTAASGGKRLQAFCASCATQLYATAASGSAPVSLRVGTIDERADLKPVRQIWRGSAIAWALDIHDLPAFEGNG